MIDALPAAPSRSDTPANFVSKADAWVAALATFVTQANALQADVDAQATAAAGSASSATGSATSAAASAAAALAATGYVATSASSISLTTGSKAFTMVESSRAFATNDQVLAIRRSDPTQRMYGQVTGVAGQVLTVNIASAGAISGSGGPYTDWVIVLAAFAANDATGADVLAASSQVTVVTPASLADASAEVVLVDGATITPDFSLGRNFVVTLGGNRTLANPLNQVVGQEGVIRVIQDGTGSRTLSFGGNWKRTGGAPTLSTAAGAEDEVPYKVLASGRVWYGIGRSPS